MSVYVFSIIIMLRIINKQKVWFIIEVDIETSEVNNNLVNFFVKFIEKN